MTKEAIPEFEERTYPIAPEQHEMLESFDRQIAAHVQEIEKLEAQKTGACRIILAPHKVTDGIVAGWDGGEAPAIRVQVPKG